MVLAAAGVKHSELVEFAKEFFVPALPPAPAAAPALAVSAYVGGDKRLIADSPMTQVSLCFDVGGWKSANLLPVCVLHMLLGGGSSFSPGGPGKGMYSRLYTNVLNKHWWCESATAFNSIHNDAGVLGVYGTCEPADAGKLVSVLAAELVDLASKEPNAEETMRAKNQLKSSIVRCGCNIYDSG
jgi:processing peptidase subunit alpha